MIVYEPKVIRRALKEARANQDQLRAAYLMWLQHVNNERTARAELEAAVIIAYFDGNMPITLIAKKSGLARSVIYKLVQNHAANTNTQEDSDHGPAPTEEQRRFRNTIVHGHHQPEESTGSSMASG